MEKTFLSNIAVLRDKEESCTSQKTITEYKQNENCDKLCISFLEKKQDKIFFPASNLGSYLLDNIKRDAISENNPFHF